MSQPRIAAFARLANGNAAPRRILEGQTTRLGRTMHGIAYNPLRDEIVVANPLAAAVLVFRGGAEGAAPPLRVIQGPKTKFVFPHAVSLDLHNREILVGDQAGRSVLAFPWDATGDTSPLRIIEGPRTKLDYVVGAAVDPTHNLLVVASTSYRGGPTGLFVFDRTANGDVPPHAVIAGPQTGMVEAPWQIQVDEGKVFVAVSNFRYAPPYKFDKVRPGLKDIPPSPWAGDLLGFIGIWDVTDAGDVPPRALIRGPLSGLVHPAGVTWSAEDREMIVADSVRNGIFTFPAPEILKGLR